MGVKQIQFTLTTFNLRHFSLIIKVAFRSDCKNIFSSSLIMIGLESTLDWSQHNRHFQLQKRIMSPVSSTQLIKREFLSLSLHLCTLRCFPLWVQSQLFLKLMRPKTWFALLINTCTIISVLLSIFMSCLKLMPQPITSDRDRFYVIISLCGKRYVSVFGTLQGLARMLLLTHLLTY